MKKYSKRPDFIGIGAGKAGTTWLHKNLQQHPSVWLPPQKELGYFKNKPMPIPNFVWAFDPRMNIGKVRRRNTKHSIQKVFSDSENRFWWFKYMFGVPTDSWYQSLFCPKPHQVSGDITPHYGTLNQQYISNIQRLLPDLKVIYLLRNPIERIWSYANMHCDVYFDYNIEIASDEEIKRLTSIYSENLGSAYLRNISNWEQHFDKSQIFIGFYDQLKQDPEQLFKDICEFLEVESSNIIVPQTISNKVNARNYPQITRKWKEYLKQSLYDDYIALDEYFQNEYTKTWLDWIENS